MNLWKPLTFYRIRTIPRTAKNCVCEESWTDLIKGGGRLWERFYATSCPTLKLAPNFDDKLISLMRRNNFDNVYEKKNSFTFSEISKP